MKIKSPKEIPVQKILQNKVTTTANDGGKLQDLPPFLSFWNITIIKIERVIYMAIIIGSARIDEKGNASGGAVGDQKQNSSSYDTVGEVSMQNFYVHSKGWIILRPKDVAFANAMAELMRIACNNVNLGYDQGNRLGVVTYGIKTTTKTECDCSSLVRECIKEATGKDPGNFNTASEVSAIIATGLFTNEGKYVSQTATPIYDGDVLVTASKGHTVIVVSGSPRNGGNQNNNNSTDCFAKYTGNSDSIIEALSAVGCKDTSKAYRTKIAEVNGISNYTGTVSQNISMVKLLKEGKLKNPGGTSNTSSVSYFSKYSGSSVSIIEGLKAVGCKDTSITYRKKIAEINVISNYSGTAAQNSDMLKRLKAGTLKKP
ncbi:MAG: hypothetical protein NC131_14265 [Roseburia sp.]|nr:hypothetical protein [Roseburia sp.]